MAQYIDKDALVAEIERRIKTNKECMLGLRNLDYYQGKVDALNDTISFIDTLEVKEMDLEKEIQRQYEVHKNPDNNIVKNCVVMTKDGFEYFAKHFFELGLNASNPVSEVNLQEISGYLILDNL